jgi:hypothetical protein
MGGGASAGQGKPRNFPGGELSGYTAVIIPLSTVQTCLRSDPLLTQVNLYPVNRPIRISSAHLYSRRANRADATEQLAGALCRTRGICCSSGGQREGTGSVARVPGIDARGGLAAAEATAVHYHMTTSWRERLREDSSTNGNTSM